MKFNQGVIPIAINICQFSILNKTKASFTD